MSSKIDPRIKGGTSHPMYGKHHTEEANLKNRKSHIGKPLPPHTEETKTKMSIARKGKYTGKNHYNYGKHLSKDTKMKIGSATSKALKGRTGTKCNGWKGGSKASTARQNNRRRQLGFININSYFEGSEAHHINLEYVVYIPKEPHKNNKHRLKNPVSMIKINKIAMYYLAPGIMPKTL